MTTSLLNPAEAAAREAQDQIYECVDAGRSFVLEAGAGAGKTHSLVDLLRYILTKRGASLIRQHKQIACITFTNVARDEIEARTDRHPAVRSDTIHGFCWSVLKDMQAALRARLPSLSRWQEALAEAGGVQAQNVVYDLGYMRIDERSISIRHSDVLDLMVLMLQESKFRTLLASRFPVFLIDEYQDTNKRFVDAIVEHYINVPTGPLFGFFGDEWQKIYGDGCGSIAHPAIARIGKRSNFRSVAAIVEPLNRMRPELTQEVRDPTAVGDVRVYHTNRWEGTRMNGAQWQGDLPVEVAHRYLQDVTRDLESCGWDLSPQRTKILMLTHNILAREQGYATIASIFKNNDYFVKKEDPHVQYLVDFIEPACLAFLSKRYGEMFAALGVDVGHRAAVTSKADWVTVMTELCRLREQGTIGEVIDRVLESRLIPVPDKVTERERVMGTMHDEDLASEPDSITRLRRLREVQFTEVTALRQFIEGHTPFSTKHGVKGAEFENVVVVVGRGWNHYNFDHLLCWFHSGFPTEKREAFERNRNLFYVVCSRPMRRLAILFTQQLSGPAISSLEHWFGPEAIRALSHL